MRRPLAFLLVPALLWAVSLATDVPPSNVHASEPGVLFHYVETEDDVRFATDKIEFTYDRRQGLFRSSPAPMPFGFTTPSPTSTALPGPQPLVGRPAYGILGTITFPTGDDLLVVVEQVKPAIYVLGLPVYEVAKVDFVHLPKLTDTQFLTNQGIQTTATNVATICTDGFYFGRALELTEPQQTFAGRAAHPDLFVANHLMRERALKMPSFPADLLVKAIRGYVSTAIIPTSSGLSLSLVSRSSRKRVGTRYHARGVDAKGYAGNFVETELLVHRPKTAHYPALTAAFLQCRGSVPLIWRQQLTSYHNIPMNVTPKIEYYSEDDARRQAFEEHFALLDALYGVPHEAGPTISPPSSSANTPSSSPLMDMLESVVVVQKPHCVDHFSRILCLSLLGSEQETCEAVLSNNYKLMAESAGRPFVHFDLTSQRSHKGWGRRMIGNMAATSFCISPTRHNESHEPLDFYISDSCHTQTAVVRTNCLDCMDRTNRAQLTIAFEILPSMLSHLDPEWSASESAREEAHRVLKVIFRGNGNNISMQYCGSSALKGHYAAPENDDEMLASSFSTPTPLPSSASIPIPPPPPSRAKAPTGKYSFSLSLFVPSFTSFSSSGSNSATLTSVSSPKAKAQSKKTTLGRIYTTAKDLSFSSYRYLHGVVYDKPKQDALDLIFGECNADIPTNFRV